MEGGPKKWATIDTAARSRRRSRPALYQISMTCQRRCNRIPPQSGGSDPEKESRYGLPVGDATACESGFSARNTGVGCVGTSSEQLSKVGCASWLQQLSLTDSLLIIHASEPESAGEIDSICAAGVCADGKYMPHKHGQVGRIIHVTKMRHNPSALLRFSNSRQIFISQSTEIPFS